MIININKDCQMSNRLILNAHCLATGISTGQKVVMCTFGDLAKYYDCMTEEIEVEVHNYNEFIGKIYRKLRGIYDVYREDRIEKYVKGLPSIISDMYRFPEKKYIIQNWYFRNYIDFEKHQDHIRNFFAPKKEIVEKVKKKIDLFRKEYNNLVAIHIRRGDYKEFQGGKFFYNDDQYIRWIREVGGILGENTLFVIFSNEKINFNDINVDFSYYVSDFSAIEDQYFMSKCDYIVGPPSTFSWWASFMGNKPYCVIDNADMSVKKGNFNTSFIKEYTKATAAGWYCSR